MARCIGAGGMVDVRSLATLEDLTLADIEKDCGVSEKKRNRYFGSKFFEELPDVAEAKNPKSFDRKKDWLRCACAVFICFVVFGILHALPLVLPIVNFTYNLGTLERTVVAAATYAVAFSFGPLGEVLVVWMGHRLTCIFGLLLLFTGLVLDAFELHVIAYYAAHLVLIGLGTCFAITAAGSSVVCHFRKRLRIALMLVTISAPTGTAFFHYLFYLLAIQINFAYKWVILINAILVLACIGLTFAIPKSSRPPRHPNPFFENQRHRREVTKNCIDGVTNDENGQGDRLDSTSPADLDLVVPARKKCFCVCVCDLSSMTDVPFLLWVIVSSCAMVTIYAPYLFILWYVDVTFQFSTLNCLYLVVWFCLTSTIGRAFVMLNNDHSYSFSRTLFQAGLAGSAVLYIILSFTTTFGWFIVWFLLGGLTEGLIVGAIPRLTLQTIPRKYMGPCWGYIVFCNGAAAIIGPYLLMSVRQTTRGDIALACVSIGVIQFSAALLSMFLPNEEGYDDEDDDSKQ